MDKLVIIKALATLCPAVLAAGCNASPPAPGAPDPYVLEAGADFRRDFPARNEDGTINVVVEIPTGTNDKWEVDEDGVMRWKLENDRPRVVRYLGYPGNYGMIPRTLLPEELGGDGDPLDVILLGPAVERGAVVRAHLVGVLTLLDGGEQDDKLLAVSAGTPFAEVEDLDQLEAEFPGVTRILEIWFASYKGPGEIEVTGLLDAARAGAILDAAARSYTALQSR